MTFPCLTHLLYLNNSEDETTLHQSMRAFHTTGDHVSACLIVFYGWIIIFHSDRLHQCLHGWPTESQLAQIPWPHRAIGSNLGGRIVRRPTCFQGYWNTAALLDWALSWITLTCHSQMKNTGNEKKPLKRRVHFLLKISRMSSHWSIIVTWLVLKVTR